MSLHVPMALLLAVALGTSDNPPCQCSGFGAWLSFWRFGLGNLGVAVWMPGRRVLESYQLRVFELRISIRSTKPPKTTRARSQHQSSIRGVSSSGAKQPAMCETF